MIYNPTDKKYVIVSKSKLFKILNSKGPIQIFIDIRDSICGKNLVIDII